MEMILHHHHQQLQLPHTSAPQPSFGADSARWPSEPLLRLPSLFRHAGEPATAAAPAATTTNSTTTERSPRLVGMSDVLNTTRAASADSPVARLPSIGSMIRRDDSARAESPVTTTTCGPATQDANSMSPAQKQCMDLFKQLREPAAHQDARNDPEYALGNLLAGAALSQLASMQEAEKKEQAAAAAAMLAAASPVRSILPSCSSDSGSESASDKSKRANSAKLCGMTECRKRAKAGGYCIAHGGGLRCSEEGCQKHAVSLGLCISHGGGKRCTIDGCLNASRKNGVCWSHGGKRLCKLDGCNKGPKSGGYCWSHGGKMKK